MNAGVQARFEEGIEQVRRLLDEEHVTCKGRFHSFEGVTSLPRPTQKPRPPFYIAAVGTPLDIIEQLHEFDRVMGGVDHASLQVNFNDMPYQDALASVRLFGEKVMPHFALEGAR